MVESRELQIYGKNKNFEYAHDILDVNNIEPPISENHNRMQIITMFAYFMHLIKFLTCCICIKSKCDKIIEFVFKFFVKWYSIVNGMTSIFSSYGYLNINDIEIMIIKLSPIYRTQISMKSVQYNGRQDPGGYKKYNNASNQ